MASKQVTDRQKSGVSVAALGETHADSIGEALSIITKAHTKKGAAPNVALLIHALAAELGEKAAAMVTADEAHQAELDDDPAVRKQRDEAQRALTDELVELREILTGLYGAALSSQVLTGTTPEDAVTLARFAGEVASKLEKAKLPASRIKGGKLDVTEVVASLRDKRSQLEATLKAVQREVREAQVTLDARDAAVAAYDATFAGVSRTLEGLLRLAGKVDLAAKVKPSSRRPGRTEADAGEGAEPPGPAAPPVQ